MSARIQHRLGVTATRERIWEVLADLDSWGQWNPLYPKAVGTIAFGGQLELTEQLEGREPQVLDFKVTDWAPGEHLILRRPAGFMTTRLQYVEIETLADASCILAAGAIFTGLGEAGQRKKNPGLRAGFEAMCEGLKARAEAG
jgi:hypothetical protein